ncbi:37107_t:CDS:2, partial [Gigaspora margarita]
QLYTLCTRRRNGSISIQQHVDRAENRMFISIIEELVKNYINNDHSIIVAMITCKDEIENQPIVTYAKEADKRGICTSGSNKA